MDEEATKTEPEAQLPSLVETPAKNEIIVSHSDLAVLDTAKFQHMWRVATAIAQSSLVPETLRKSGNTDLPVHTVIANCFKVVNQAVRWNMDPFALIDCASIIKGRLCWEGKVIAAVLDSLLGVELNYSYEGEGDAMKVTVTGRLRDGEARHVYGTVGQWKTTGSGSPWSKAADYQRQLAYRGAREWARRHKPSVVLGVYAPDEMHEFDRREPIDVTPGVDAQHRSAMTPEPRALPQRRGAQVPAREPLTSTSSVSRETEPPDTPIGNMAEPQATPARRTGKPEPIKGKPTKADKYADVPDLDERDWLEGFEGDLKSAPGLKFIKDIIDRREAVVERLSPAAQTMATEIMNAALKRFARG